MPIPQLKKDWKVLGKILLSVQYAVPAGQFGHIRNHDAYLHTPNFGRSHISTGGSYSVGRSSGSSSRSISSFSVLLKKFKKTHALIGKSLYTNTGYCDLLREPFGDDYCDDYGDQYGDDYGDDHDHDHD